MWNVSLLALLPLLSSGTDLRSRPAEILRSRAARLDVATLTGERLRIELFEEETVDAVRERIVPTSPDGFVWIGGAPGDETSSIVLSVHRGVLSASLRLGSAQYRIRPEGAGLSRIEEVSPFAESPEEEPLAVVPSFRAHRAGIPDGGEELDLLVVYTPRARDSAGGPDGIAALVALGVAETNLALEKSGVATKLRLVELREVPFAEAGRVASDLEILKQETDGALDEVHALRDAYGADLVQLVVEEGDGCGIAYSMGRSGASFSEWAFSIVERSCIDTSYAVAHEIGHNLGCDHAPEDPTTRGAFEFSFGYKDVLAGFRTVMAYGPGKRVPRFSSSRVLFDGVPMGSVRQDNARTLNELRRTAARFRRGLAPPRLSSTPGTIPGSARFRVSSDGPPIREWRLLVGTSPGAGDVFDGGARREGELVDAYDLSRQGALFGRLWYRRGAIWLYEDVPLRSR